ncbi:MAG: hypothetical protein KDJ43_06975 [Rhizobiaceae bacterium]|nr:hypothetical protein [Rhizobiaceae bacterium]
MALLLLGAASCSLTKQKASDGRSPARASSYHHDNPVPSQRRVAYLKGDDLQRVRTGEFVKTYHLGRTPSKDGNTMHEAHRVYQIGKTSRWNLARGNPPLQPTGPIRRTVDSAFKPLPEDQRIAAELNRQREITERLDAVRAELEANVTEARRQVLQKAKDTAAPPTATPREEVRRAEPTTPDHASEPTPSPTETLKAWGDALEAQERGKPIPKA